MHKCFLTTIAKDDINEFDLLTLWKNNCKSLPYVAELARKYLCIPLTGTSSERAFSYADILIGAKRRSLGPSVVEKTLFIHDGDSIPTEKLSVFIVSNFAQNFHGSCFPRKTKGAKIWGRYLEDLLVNLSCVFPKTMRISEKMTFFERPYLENGFIDF